MTVLELYSKLTERIPSSLSCSWDGDGFEVCPDQNACVRRVLISLDVTNECIDHAVNNGYDVIISHHPLLFKGISEVSNTDADGARVIRLIKNNISTMSFHTRLDALDGGVNDVLSSVLGLCSVKAAECDDDGMMRVGELKEEMDARDFALYVKEKLHAPSVRLASANKKVFRVALLGGSGGSCAHLLAACGADTYVTGEFKHHELLDPCGVGANLIEAGHFYTEYPVCSMLRDTVSLICPEAECDIYFSDRTEIL